MLLRYLDRTDKITFSMTLVFIMISFKNSVSFRRFCNLSFKIPFIPSSPSTCSFRGAHSNSPSVSSNKVRMLEPGGAVKPTLTNEQVTNLVKTHFGFNVNWIKELDGYWDRNYHILCDSDQNNTEWVVKVFNSLDTENRPRLEAMGSAMLYLAKKGIKCPVPQKALNGQDVTLVNVKDGNNQEHLHALVLITFLPGETMFDVPPTYKLLYETGKYAARFQATFKVRRVADLRIAISKCGCHDFQHSSLKHYAETSIWAMECIKDLRGLLNVFCNELEKRDLVKNIIDEFESRVMSIASTLEKGTIHCDLHEGNLIIGSPRDEFPVDFGVIDFGEICESPMLFDLAILIAGTLTYCTERKVLGALEGATALFKGFNSVRPMPQNELRILKVCVAGRLCQSLVLGLSSLQTDCENAYIQECASLSWRVLSTFWNQVSNEEFIETLTKNEEISQES